MSTQFRLPRWARRFAGDVHGVSAVEFALLLPLLITLYLGGLEMSQAIATSRKVTLVSRTVGDLASQSSKITASAMTGILSASAAIISPYSSTKLKVTVSQVKIDSNGTATIDWSETLNGTKHAVGSSVTLPSALNVADTYLIWTEAQYDYAPTIGYAIVGTLTLKDQMYMRPRLSNNVVYPAT